jgi:hypothetical protein
VAGDSTGRGWTVQPDTPSGLLASPMTLTPQRRCDRKSMTVSSASATAPALCTVTTFSCGSCQAALT